MTAAGTEGLTGYYAGQRDKAAWDLSSSPTSCMAVSGSICLSAYKNVSWLMLGQ
jgi:hypothetical protein